MGAKGEGGGGRGGKIDHNSFLYLYVSWGKFFLLREMAKKKLCFFLVQSKNSLHLKLSLQFIPLLADLIQTVQGAVLGQ